MLIEIPHCDHPRFLGGLRKTVSATFGGYGYIPEEAERFLSNNDQPFEDKHYILMDGDQCLAHCMRYQNEIEYVLPTVWNDRYLIAKKALTELIGAYQSLDHGQLRMRIREDMPSHASWFAALMPGLGFEMTPRMRMTSTVEGLLLQKPLQEFSKMEPQWLDECLEVYVQAHEPWGGNPRETVNNVAASVSEADRLDSWAVARRDDRVVGFCFGSVHRGRFFVEELAVQPAFQGRNLGRGLLLASMSRLNEQHPRVSEVRLDVTRTVTPAVRLYRSLGFAVEEHYVVAEYQGSTSRF